MKSMIEIKVTPQGDIIIDALGFHGADCERATACLEQALGKVKAKHRKPEYYRRCQVLKLQRVGQ